MTEPPATTAELARALGYSKGKLRALKEEHGDKLVPYMQSEWRRLCVEQPRFMASQSGTFPNYESFAGDEEYEAESKSEGQYVSTSLRAIEDAETVPEHVQREQSGKARTRFAERENIEHAAERAHKASEQLARQIRNEAISIARKGGDPFGYLAQHQRLLSERQSAA